MEASVKHSATRFADRISELAHSAAGKPVPETTKESVPLVPIYIGVDRDHEQLREMFLYRHGDKQWSVKPAASRFLLETSLPGNMEKTVQDQITAGLKPYRDWQDPGQEQLVALQLYARLKDHVFRDELLWDVSNPQNTADTYVMRVCGDLGLGCDWYDAIKSHLDARLQEVRQDLQEAPDEVQLQQPGEAALAALAAQQQQQPGTPSSLATAATTPATVGVPRVEPYDASRDIEASRLAARQQVLQIRQNKKQQAAAAAAQQQQQQQKGQGTPHPAAMPQQLASPKTVLQQQPQPGISVKAEQQQQQPVIEVKPEQQPPQQQVIAVKPELQQQQQQAQPQPQQQLPAGAEQMQPLQQQQQQQLQPTMHMTQQPALLPSQQQQPTMPMPQQQQLAAVPQQVLQSLPQPTLQQQHGPQQQQLLQQQQQAQQQAQPQQQQVPHMALPAQMTPQQIQQLQQQLMHQQQLRQ